MRRWKRAEGFDAYVDTLNIYPIITALEVVNGYQLWRYDMRIKRASLDRALTLYAQRRVREQHPLHPWKIPR